MIKVAKVLALSVCGLFAFTASLTLADEEKVTQESDGALNDMKVVRDKNTGKLRAPTAEENAELAASKRALAPSVVVVSRPTSSVEFRADGSAVGKRSLDDLDDLVLTEIPEGEGAISHASSSESSKMEVEPDSASQSLPKE